MAKVVSGDAGAARSARRQGPADEPAVDARDVTWITDIQELEPVPPSEVRFQSTAKRPGQPRGLHARRCFAAELVRVTASAGDA